MGWDLFLLAVVVLMGPFAVREAVHARRCPACRAARQAVRDRHPGCRVFHARHLAAEPDRDVVAVFYQPKPHPFYTTPDPFQLVAVARGSGEATELPDEPGSPYGLLGRK